MQRFNALSGRGKAGVGCLSVFVLMFICGSCLNVFGGDDTPAPVADAPTVEVVDDVVTLEPVTETDAPEDTDEPPTETPAAGMDPEVVAYLEWAGEQLSAIGTTLGLLGPTLGRLGEDPTLLLNDDYKIEVATKLAFLKAFAQGVKDYEDVPDAAQGVHIDMMRMAENLDQAADLYAAGFDNVDAEKFVQANEKMAAANALMPDIQAGAEELKGDQ